MEWPKNDNGGWDKGQAILMVSILKGQFLEWIKEARELGVAWKDIKRGMKLMFTEFYNDCPSDDKPDIKAFISVFDDCVEMAKKEENV